MDNPIFLIKWKNPHDREWRYASNQAVRGQLLHETRQIKNARIFTSVDECTEWVNANGRTVVGGEHGGWKEGDKFEVVWMENVAETSLPVGGLFVKKTFEEIIGEIQDDPRFNRK